LPAGIAGIASRLEKSFDFRLAEQATFILATYSWPILQYIYIYIYIYQSLRALRENCAKYAERRNGAIIRDTIRATKANKELNSYRIRASKADEPIQDRNFGE